MKKNNILNLLFIGFVLIISIKISPFVINKSGEYFLSEKKYSQAKKLFKIAISLKPKNFIYRYNYVKVLSKLKPTYEIQKEMFFISQSSQDDLAKKFADDIVKSWRSQIHQNIGNNYIEQVPSSALIIRWNKNSFPLKVYLNKNDLNKLPQYYYTAIQNSFKQWNQSIDFISFTVTNSPENANIIIKFDSLPPNVCNDYICKYVIGYTSSIIKNNKLKQMVITLYNKNHLGNYYSHKEIYNTILHELGHALGIMGHSYNSNDLMYQESKEHTSIFANYRSDFMYLSEVDINTITLLYKLVPNICNKDLEDKSDLIYAPIILGNIKQIAERKLKEANYYIKKSPDLAIGYMNKALALEQLNQDKNAIKTLHIAEKLAKDNNEKKVIYNNLAIIYHKIEDYENADKYLKMSQKF